MSPDNATARQDIQDIRGYRMSKLMFGRKLLTAVAFGVVVSMPLGSTVALAASHNIVMSAEILPNGQHGYKMVSHGGNQGSAYPATAVIPGPNPVRKAGRLGERATHQQHQGESGFQGTRPFNWQPRWHPARQEAIA